MRALRLRFARPSATPPLEISARILRSEPATGFRPAVAAVAGAHTLALDDAGETSLCVEPERTP
jgi:hypothetical protein